jgi:hypothetical protein
MAYATLAEWSVAFLRASSAYNKALDGYGKKIGFYTRFGGRAPSSATSGAREARNNLVNVCNELSSVLTVGNKTTILSELNSILSLIKGTNLSNGEKVSSYYSNLTAWFEKNIKPLL